MPAHGADTGRPAVGAVLAGGAGSRMGEPKALVDLAGRPLLSYPVAAVNEAGLEPIVVAKAGTELPETGAEVVLEPAEPRHPLHGVVAALERARGRPVIALACDMPFVPAELLAWLAGLEGRAIVCEADGRLQPLLALYRGVAEQLAAAVQEGEASRDAVMALEPRVVGERELSRFGDPARICFNVNTADDLRVAATMLEAGR